MSFLLVAFPAAVAVALHLRKSEPQRALRVAAATAGVMLLVLGYGTLRLIQSDQHNNIKVGLVTSDLPENDRIVHAGPDAERLLTQYAAQASKLAARGAQVIVMPEKLAAVRDSDTPVDDAILQSVANSSGAIIVAGELQVSPDATGTGTLRYNRAKVYRPQAPVSSYNKEHMLPPLESDETPGTEKLLFKSGPNTLGVAICKDMDFTSMSLAYADLGAHLMLVPGWDFNVDGVWHGHMAIMRGVEGGFSVARAAKDGYLFVSDDRGRVLAETRSDAAPFATLLADVPVGHEPTLFQRWGNWFAWVAVAAFATSLARLTALLLSSRLKLNPQTPPQLTA
jgi:apolipoprotein N-acyltransferase